MLEIGLFCRNSIPLLMGDSLTGAHSLRAHPDYKRDKKKEVKGPSRVLFCLSDAPLMLKAPTQVS